MFLQLGIFKMSLFRKIYNKQQFDPDWLIGIWVNPYFIIRRSLMLGIRSIASEFFGGKLLDVGCGSKPYKHLFQVDTYLGIDVETSGHDHGNSMIDKFYDGKMIPFSKEEFDWVFSSEVFEHVFNIDELLPEIYRILKPNGCLGFTCPFAWNEHEQPYDYARYTSFAIQSLMEKHGFEILLFEKSTSYIETVMQMFSTYVYQNCLPQNALLRLLLSIIFVSPINIMGMLFAKILPRDRSLYHNNIVIARKL